MNPAPISLEQLFRYYRSMPHQAAAVKELEQDLKEIGYEAAMRRDRPWFETWSQDGKQADLAAGIALIKEFEGVHLVAYPDPLTGEKPWTIGYGTTRYSGGMSVKQGDRITIIEADMLLRLEVDRIAAKLRKSVPYWREMDDNQKSALVSFAYNLGCGFCGTAGFETISRCLEDRDWDGVPEALKLYRNPGTNVEAGLLRRRIAEGELWAGQERKPAKVAKTSLTAAASFDDYLTSHIQLGEFALYQEARRFDTDDQVVVAGYLAEFLERVRSQFGDKPLTITSGYRPAAINSSVGGSKNSEHLYKPGCGAVDFYIEGADIYQVQTWCDTHWPHSLGYGAYKGFIHLGLRNGGAGLSDAPRVRWDY